MAAGRPPSLTRRVLRELEVDDVRHAIDFYELDRARLKEDMVDSLVRDLGPDLTSIVSADGPFTIDFWNGLLESLGGRPRKSFDGVREELTQQLDRVALEFDMSQRVADIREDRVRVRRLARLLDLDHERMTAWLEETHGRTLLGRFIADVKARLAADAERSVAPVPEGAFEAVELALQGAEEVSADVVSYTPTREFFALTSLLEIVFDGNKESLCRIAERVGLPQARSESARTVAERISRSSKFGRNGREKLLAVLELFSADEAKRFLRIAAAQALTDFELALETVPWEQHRESWWSVTVLYVADEDRVAAMGGKLGKLATEMADAAYGGSDSSSHSRRLALREVIARHRDCFRLVRYRTGDHDDLPIVTRALSAATVVAVETISDDRNANVFVLAELCEAIFSGQKQRIHDLALGLGVPAERRNSSVSAVAEQLAHSGRLGSNSKQRALKLLAQLSESEVLRVVALLSAQAATDLDRVTLPSGVYDNRWHHWESVFIPNTEQLQAIGPELTKLAHALLLAAYGDGDRRERREGLRTVLDDERWRGCFRQVRFVFDGDELGDEPANEPSREVAPRVEAEAQAVPNADDDGESDAHAETRDAEDKHIGLAQPFEMFLGYSLNQSLGGGGMAEAWRATDPSGRVVFLKRARLDTHQGNALLREQNIYERLVRREFPHILNILAYERTPRHVTPEYVALVTDFATGGDLKAFVQEQGGELSARAAKPIAAAILSALRSLHALDVVHRDLKPHNVLRHNDQWVLADFGIAKNLSRGITQYTFQAHGTLGYAAPEQLELGDAQPSADIYSFGKVVTFLLTGHTDPDRIPQPSWRAFVRRCTREDPNSRPLAGDVELMLSELPA